MQQMALPLRDQGEISPARRQHRRRAARLRDPDLDRRRAQHLRVAAALVRCRPGRCSAWRRFRSTDAPGAPYSVATRERVIQVAQPVEIRQRLRRARRLARRPAAGPDHAARRAPDLVARGDAARAAPAPGRRAARRDAQSLAPLATGRLPDELAPLADSLNALLDRLRQSLDAQRAFVADARTSCARRSPR
jgi:two-component system OmpR family sensor kinase/two-component system sensor histidine kinase QseC